MEEINEIEYPNLFNLFEEYRNEVVRLLKQRLEQAGRRASGQLIDNINTSIKSKGSDIIISLISADYLGAVAQEGRSPTKHNGDGTVRKKILDWVKQKNILPTPRQDKNGKTYLPTQEQLAYLIARKIHQEGNKLYRTGGDDLVESVINDVNAKYIPLFIEALERDFERGFAIKIVDDINKMLKI